MSRCDVFIIDYDNTCIGGSSSAVVQRSKMEVALEGSAGVTIATEDLVARVNATCMTGPHLVGV